ncbi:MAG: hypothetical protein WCL14_07730, partial [Bacteroidota bacterium]
YIIIINLTHFWKYPLIKLIRSNLPSRHSPDSSGSPLLCVGIGEAAATADSGTQMIRVETVGS